MELCLECIGRALGISEEKIEVTAPKDFNVTSLQDEIALNISLLQAGGLGSGKLVKALKERIVKKLGFSKEDTKAINNELSEDPVNQSPYLGAV
jgi:hypothetical protein